MGYLGNRPAESYASFEKQVFTIVNSQTAYTLDHSVVNENDIRLVVNNVVQEPGSGKAYTASGTSLTLSAALVNGTDTMYAVFLGKAVQTVNPPAASVGTSQLAATSVTAAKLNNDIISGTTALASEPSDTDEFLVSDSGTLKRIDYSLIKGGGLAEADQRRLTSDFASDAIITANLERTDTYGFGQLGTGMTESSGVFTFPSTGFYLIMYQGRILSNNYGNATLTIMVTTNNSDYNNAGMATQGNDGTGDDGTATGIYIVDVTSTTNVKVKFRTNSFGSGTTLRGNTDRSDTCFTFIKLGDT